MHPDQRARGTNGTGRFNKPGEVTLTLYAVALKLLKDAGSQVALGVTNKPGMKRLLARYGGQPIGDVTLFGKGLRP